ncbi:MAG TPA: ABC transporter permease [Coriobacteriia bacterium]|nr:ABC transporter permease [Coriobacteriia bacterium]
MSHAVRIGLARGWTDFSLSIRSVQDQISTAIMPLVTIGYLYYQRDVPVEGTTLMLPAVALPSILAALIVFGLVTGPAFQLAMDREDGTLLRAKCAPHGTTGYVTGQIVLHALNTVLVLVVIMVPSAIVFDAFGARGAHGWLAFAWVVGLGLLATMPIGIILGSVVPNSRATVTWAFLPLMALVAISGILFPITRLWEWVQVVAQMFPMYWLGLGLRSAFLPAEAAVLEIGGSWRPLETALVLGAWAAAGLSMAPRVLRRMARRQSGAAVAQARDEVAQWGQ